MPQVAPVQPEAMPQVAPVQPEAMPQVAPVQPEAMPQVAPVQPDVSEQSVQNSSGDTLVKDKKSTQKFIFILVGIIGAFLIILPMLFKILG